MEDTNVGQKIAEYRKSKSLNIRELGKLAKVTPSMISQIERGLANPSINTLKLIAKALEVPLFTFFIDSVSTYDRVVRADKRKKIIFPDSRNFGYELLSPDLNGSIELALMTLTPNSCSSEEVMSHKGEEAALVIKGKIKLSLGDDEIILYTGDSVRIQPHDRHKWENIFDSDAEVVFAITPPSF
ncbi:helix-turn-helix domain-containing protein [Clostridium estertheticum]|uniref:helix-turn-helix domain-containing protein n=1 Tax=Clostridium estertheticum TaxID=238834 RepID=UPI0013E9429E|nr:helix-turn-helix domain-containing protein [Clostridium estertheticum]MBZ9687026.1 helix-turn-helix domain-containing protein [Clostridium estertheticum]